MDFENETSPPVRAKTPRKNGCVRTLGISCLVLAILCAVVVTTITVVATRNPAVRQLYSSGKSVGICELQMAEIGAALDRYVIKNGKYPDRLTDLYPKFLENRGLLHCPADPRPKNVVTYVYFQPRISDPGSKIVLICNHQVNVPGQPPVPVRVLLFKNGRVKTEVGRPLPSVSSSPTSSPTSRHESLPSR